MSDDNEKVIPISNVKKLKKHLHYPNMNGYKVLDTKNNLELLLELNFIKVRWNTMLRCREIDIPGVNHFADEKENADLAHIYHLATTNRMPTAHLDIHLNSIAWEHPYHPIVECINNNPWDGVHRLDKFIACLKTKDNDYTHSIVKRWMISAIAACHAEKGIASQGVLVLQGKQNLGKTRWVKSLDPTNGDAVKEGLLIDPSNKDTVITANQCWIGELGELDGNFRKADIARLKSFITNSVDVVRLPYNARNSYFYRRSVFVATVNESNFLVDDTGNRRWWTIEIESIDFSHGLDMKQIWSEVYHVWTNENQTTWLTSDEIKKLSEVNEQHEIIDPFEEKFLLTFDFRPGWQQETTLHLTCTEVLEKIGYNKPNRADLTRMGKIIIKHTGIKPRKRSLSYHVLPLLKIDLSLPKDF